MKRYSIDEAREKIYRYCAYQERNHQEVKNKLYSYGLYSSDVDELLTQLITEGFLNEERYARAYAGGKFRMKKWGRLKIINSLEGKGLTKNCIKAGLSEISETDYEQTLVEVLSKKISETSEENTFVLRDKVSKSAIMKGYEPELVWKLLRTLVPDRR